MQLGSEANQVCGEKRDGDKSGAKDTDERHPGVGGRNLPDVPQSERDNEADDEEVDVPDNVVRGQIPAREDCLAD